MKKSLVLLMVVLLGISILFVVGCGSGDTPKAQQYLKQADASWSAIDKQLNQLSQTLTTTLGGAFSGDYSAITAAVLQPAVDSINKALQEMPNVKAEYAKVNSLSGVADYKAYADAMQKAIDSYSASMTAVKQLLEGLIPLAGNQAAIAQYVQQQSSQVTKLQEATNKAAEQLKAAQQIKQDKKLKF
ncbi:MAG TPA: hypothetical protein VIK22_08970 [Candidatus Anoxymicrobiaceae bacterium]